MDIYGVIFRWIYYLDALVVGVPGEHLGPSSCIHVEEKSIICPANWSQHGKSEPELYHALIPSHSVSGAFWTDPDRNSYHSPGGGFPRG